MVVSVNFDVASYARGWGPAFVTVLRTLIFDWWIRQFLDGHRTERSSNSAPG